MFLTALRITYIFFTHYICFFVTLFLCSIVGHLIGHLIVHLIGHLIVHPISRNVLKSIIINYFYDPKPIVHLGNNLILIFEAFQPSFYSRF